MLHKDTKAMVRPLDGDTDFADTVIVVLQRDTLVFITCQDYVLRTSIDLMKENSFKLKKIRDIWYPAGTITDTDYADYLALLSSTPAQTETDASPGASSKKHWSLRKSWENQINVLIKEPFLNWMASLWN